MLPTTGPKYHPGSYLVGIPKEVCDSGRAFIFGLEWGPEKGRCMGIATKPFRGWVYYVVFVPEGGFKVYNGIPYIPAGERVEVGEEELERWNVQCLSRNSIENSVSSPNLPSPETLPKGS